MSDPIGLYIHWPFCKSKCPYCDFNSHVRNGIDEAQWQQALIAELRYFHARSDRRILRSIFFGGGTPSLMSPKLVGALIDEAHKLFNTESDIEITLEANPTSVEAQNFIGYRAAGVNRLSLGVQSFNADDLKFLGRQHSVEEAEAAIKLAEQHFPRFSFDLIYARPNQTLDAWKHELDHALRYAVGHISLYQLTIEPDTGFAQQYKRGAFELPEESLAATLYDYTAERLARDSLHHYEISNYAKEGEESRHNKIYWQYEDYIGIGPGAHGRIRHNGTRHATTTIKQPERWLSQTLAHGNGLESDETISIDDTKREAILMGLRLAEGVCKTRWKHKFGSTLEADLNAEKLSALIDNGDLLMTENSLAATKQGRLRLTSLLDFLLN